ncbi:MAG: hypothetical protein SPI77_07195 [Corynebacterium sp.]|nr:hypothetical protein [Corynebacterium sp.]
MTLLISVFAAVGAIASWYTHPQAKLRLGVLCWLYVGASLMWCVDAIATYFEDPEALFSPAPQDMLNDTFLGLSVVALGAVIWVIVLLVSDPRGVVRRSVEVGK